MTLNDLLSFLGAKMGRTKLYFALFLTPLLYVKAGEVMAVDVTAGVAAYAVACVPFLGYAFGQPSEKERSTDNVKPLKP